LSRRSLGEGGWFVLFAFGKLKSRAFHALFVFPFQGQGKTKPSRKRLLTLGEQRKRTKKYPGSIKLVLSEVIA
jgi:hypothetical protein